MTSSTPTLNEFVPLKSQLEVIRAVRRGDYTGGTKEIVLSGSIGSSKSLVLAHLAVTHCLMNEGAKFGIGRLALPQLKDTLCIKIIEHLGNDVDYKYNRTTGDFYFPNGSRITSVSWADGNLVKLGSQEFSAFAIEELTETRVGDPYERILQRVNRVPHVREPFLVSATNPDSPSHWAYKKLITDRSVQVFYSNTFDNPYLPKSYIELLKSRMDERVAQRMIYGKWIEILSEVVYYAYSEKNLVLDDYKIDPKLPIRLMFDFNIGEGKPLSIVMGQYRRSDDSWHFFDECIVEGQRTRDALEELEARGVFENDNMFIVHGDASGKSRDTRGSRSDYGIIEYFLQNVTNKQNKKIRFDIQIPRANPRIRDRHNVVNGYMRNASGDVKLFVYPKAKTLDEGFRLTKLKRGANYLEDDSDYFQHCTTAIGYGIYYVHEITGFEESRSSGIIGGF